MAEAPDERPVCADKATDDKPVNADEATADRPVCTEDGSKMPNPQPENLVKYPDCTWHTGNFKDHYCIDHSEMICSECIKRTHQSCFSAPLSVICKDLGSADIQQFEILVDAMKQNVLLSKSALENNDTDIENQKEDLIKQAKEERDKLISQAENFYDNTVSLFADACKQKSAYIREKVATLGNIVHSLDETKIDITKILNIKLDQNVFIRMQKIVEKVRRYKSEIENMNKLMKKITLSFSPSSEVSTFLSVNKYLGDVKEISSQLGVPRSLPETVFPQASALTRKAGVSKTRCDISQISVNQKSSFDIRLKQDKETYKIRGIAVTSKGIVLVSDCRNKSVKAFSQNNKVLSSLTFSRETCAISVINDQTAAVSTYNNELYILNISDPANISIGRDVSLDYRASGMTHYKGNLIVTSWTKPKCVKMIDLNGQEKWSVSVDHKGHQLFDRPRSVTISTSYDTSTVIVGDWGKDTLTLIDPNDGHLIKTIDVKGKRPHGLTSDNDGNVYVCYFRTNEICVFSPDFQKSCILLSSSDLRRDSTNIAYCSNSDVLYIAYKNNDTIDCFQLA